MGRANANFENVKWAVENLKLESVINTLPHGYDTQLDPQGRHLPRSTVQKLLLARSIADKPKLLLLEDALEHLDVAERRSIVDFLVDKKNGWTIVAVSADPYFQSKADKVIQMNEGCFTQTSKPE
jgi:ABC-type transport system involved in cytochrome bd biosynthesis fused ATPase/permease subunit